MANLKNVTKKTKAQAMGMHTEVLTGRTQQKFFNPDEAENFYYFGTYDVDFNKRTDLDVKEMTAAEANKEIDNLDIPDGEYREIDLTRPPFLLPKPLHEILDKDELNKNSGFNCYLNLYTKNQINELKIK